MSSCLSGRAYAYGFDLENILKSSSSSSSYATSTQNSNLSILSESSSSVSTRKPRTPRKRPNQTYNEAAALLSTACPAIFSVTNKRSELPNQHTYFFNESPELLLIEKPVNVKPREIEFNGRWIPSSLEQSEGYPDDFDTESMLDEEIGEGIDSIMGNSNSNSNSNSNVESCFRFDSDYKTCYGYPVGLGFGGNLECNFGFGLRNGVRALKNVDEGDWPVNVMNISPPATKKSPAAVKKKKKKKVAELMKSEPECSNGEESSSLENGTPLLLKLNYEKVMKAWSDKGSPLPGGDIHARLAHIDLFSENGGFREAIVNRYKKAYTVLFQKDQVSSSKSRCGSKT